METERAKLCEASEETGSRPDKERQSLGRRKVKEIAAKEMQSATLTTTGEEQRMSTTPRIWLWLTGPIAVLVAIAAGVGFFIDDIYRDAPVNAAQAVGQDLITLVVALPTLVISAILALRGSRRAHLVWLGVLVYLVYTYLTYALAIQFNPLFLVYVALLGCSAPDRRPGYHGLRGDKGTLLASNTREGGEYLPRGRGRRVLLHVVERRRPCPACRRSASGRYRW